MKNNFTVFIVLALTILLVKALKPGNIVVPILSSPENFSKVEWKDIFNKMNNHGIDSVPQGKLKIPSNAGKRSSSVSHHIIGGSSASLGSFPWQAFIVQDKAYVCGGSLIHQQWVLTAAHCAAGRINFEITLGAANRSFAEAGRIILSTTTKFVHENYSTNFYKNDVALLKLPRLVNLTVNINLIRLPKVSDGSKSFSGTIAIVSGWGLTKNGGTVSLTLNQVTLSVIVNSECAKVYGTSQIINSTLCTSGAGFKGACGGDSGGPLVFKAADGKWTQVGVVSFGAANCTSGYPTAFARVTSFLGWISSKSYINCNNNLI